MSTDRGRNQANPLARSTLVIPTGTSPLPTQAISKSSTSQVRLPVAKYPQWHVSRLTPCEIISGTGADIFGAAYCIFEGNNTRTALPYKPHLDGAEVSYPEAVKADAGYPLIYTVSGLADEKHTVRFQDLSVNNCISEAKGGVIKTVDYALITLSQDTRIHPQTDLLLAGHDDPFIVYSDDGWAPAIDPGASSAQHYPGISESLSMPVMRTTSVGSWVSFSFFGTYRNGSFPWPTCIHDDFSTSAGSHVAAAGSMNIGEGSCPAPGWCTELSLQVSLDGEVSEHKYPKSDKASPFFWETTNLSDLPNGAPHVVNITLLDAPKPSGDTESFRVAGFAYTPAFTSLAEGNKLWEKAPASPGGSTNSAKPDASKQDSDKPSTDTKASDTTSQASSNAPKAEDADSSAAGQSSIAMSAMLCVLACITSVLLFA